MKAFTSSMTIAAFSLSIGPAWATEPSQRIEIGTNDGQLRLPFGRDDEGVRAVRLSMPSSRE